MPFDQHNPTHRAGLALAAAGLITFAVWGAWVGIAFVVGALGWVVSRIGSVLLGVSSAMTAVHANVAWIALGCGALVGAILGFNLRVDRLWERFAKDKPALDERSPSA